MSQQTKSQDYRLLHNAIIWRKSDGTVKQIIETSNADEINAAGPLGETPLHLAVQYGRYSIGIIEILLESDKIEVNKKSGSGHTPLDYFDSFSKNYDSKFRAHFIEKLLLEHGAQRSLTNSESEKKELVQSLEQNNESIQVKKQKSDSEQIQNTQTLTSTSSENDSKVIPQFGMTLSNRFGVPGQLCDAAIKIGRNVASYASNFFKPSFNTSTQHTQKKGTEVTPAFKQN